MRQHYRRRLLARAGALAAIGMTGLPAIPTHAHNDAGPVAPPQLAPEWPVTWHNGARSSLRQSLRGRITAVQTMFTGCSATCPIQGALFAQVQQGLARRLAQAQLLSLSIDPLSDDPRALAQWLARFGAGSSWKAGAPAIGDVDRLVTFLRARNQGADKHTAQVYLFNARGELVMRSTDFPAAELVVQWMLDLATRG